MPAVTTDKTQIKFYVRSDDIRAALKSAADADMSEWLEQWREALAGRRAH
jgi:hypothetical protein